MTIAIFHDYYENGETHQSSVQIWRYITFFRLLDGQLDHLEVINFTDENLVLRTA